MLAIHNVHTHTIILYNYTIILYYYPFIIPTKCIHIVFYYRCIGFKLHKITHHIQKRWQFITLVLSSWCCCGRCLLPPHSSHYWGEGEAALHEWVVVMWQVMWLVMWQVMWCNHETLGMRQLLTSTCVTSQLAAHATHVMWHSHDIGQIMWQVMWPPYFSKWIFLVAAPSTSGPQWWWWLPLGSAEFPPPPDRPPPSAR